MADKLQSVHMPDAFLVYLRILARKILANSSRFASFSPAKISHVRYNHCRPCTHDIHGVCACMCVSVYSVCVCVYVYLCVSVCVIGSNIVKVWDVLAGGRLLASFSNHQKTITSLCFDGSYHRLLSASLDRCVTSALVLS